MNGETAEGHRCPRREESVHGLRPGLDTWFERRPGAGRQCSYCGSLHPDDLFTAIEAGCQLGPTDKSYKVYVDLVEPNPDEERVFSVANHKPDGDGWQEVTEESRQTIERDGWTFRPGDWFRTGRRGPTIHGKFYFQHLDDAEAQRFVDLYNAKKMNIGYPGHFYRLPFFMRLVDPATT